MVRVLYGDILLLIDFCMNFFVLYTTSVILHRKIKLICITSAAIIGGIYSVIKLFVSGNEIVDCIISLSVGFLMCYISFGSYRFLKTIVAFFGISSLVGGIMFGTYYLLGSYHYDIYGNLNEYAYTNIPIWLFVLLAAISMFISWIFSYLERDSFDEDVRTLYVEHNGRKNKIELLLDTGNLAKEPISGKKVILLGKWAAKSILDDSTFADIINNDTEKLLKKKFRLICVSGIDGKKQMYYGFLPEKLYIENKNKRIEKDAYIAICDKNFLFDGFDGVVHPSAVI